MLLLYLFNQQFRYLYTRFSVPFFMYKILIIFVIVCLVLLNPARSDRSIQDPINLVVGPVRVY